jgi:hypothetical protein
MRNGLVLLVMGLLVTAASADVIATDPAGDGFGIGIMDLTKLEASTVGTDLVLTLTVNGDVGATNWGKYLVFIDTAAGGGASQFPNNPPPVTNDANPWFRNIACAPSHLADYFIGSWVDGGGGSQLWQFTGVGSPQWNNFAGAGLVITPGAVSTLQYTVPLASLGIGVGNTIYLEACSTGGGDYDTAVDTVNNPSNDFQAVGWGDQALIANSSPYTITPEPASLALLALGGLALIRRR